MKTEQEIQFLINHLSKNDISLKLSKIYNIYDLINTLEWVLQPSLDGEEILSTESNIKRKELTCYLCLDYPTCSFRDDIYNTDGDCLGGK